MHLAMPTTDSSDGHLICALRTIVLISTSSGVFHSTLPRGCSPKAPIYRWWRLISRHLVQWRRVSSACTSIYCLCIRRSFSPCLSVSLYHCISSSVPRLCSLSSIFTILPTTIARVPTNTINIQDVAFRSPRAARDSLLNHQGSRPRDRHH
jgi:hypothetical protein